MDFLTTIRLSCHPGPQLRQGRRRSIALATGHFDEHARSGISRSSQNVDLAQAYINAYELYEILKQAMPAEALA